MFLRNCWYVAAHASELGRTLLARRILNEPVVMYRTAAGVPVAMLDRCPHRLVPLSIGKLEGDEVVCGYHGIRLRPDGRCTEVPGQDSVPAAARARVFPMVERHLMAWIWMGDPALVDPALVPDVHWIDEPGWTPAEGYVHFKADYRLVTDNLLDLSHETFVHKETIGNDAVADHPVALTVTGEGVIRAHREMPDIEPPPFFARLQGGDSRVTRLQTACWSAPGINLTDARFFKMGQPRETALEFRVYHLLTPETERSTHYFWSLARNFGEGDSDMTAYIQAATGHTFGEDKMVLELQQQGLDEAPPGSPFPGVAFVIDGAPVRARRILDELIAREQREQVPVARRAALV